MDLVLVGDSIRLGYQPHVEAVLDGLWRVSGPGVNCRSSRHLRANLEHWVLDHLHGPSVVHLNVGLHDLRRAPERAWGVQVALDEYEENVGEILDRLLRRDEVQRLVVATTTPVDPVRHRVGNHPFRLPEDVAHYNRALRRAARERNLPIHDLHAVVRRLVPDPLSADGVHLTRRAQEVVGGHVARLLIT